MTTRLALALAIAGAMALATAPAATAAGMFVVPPKPCYHSGEQLGIGGGGFSPNGSVRITSDGAQIGVLATDPQGSFGGVLTVGQPSGEKVKTYTATDQANPALAASTMLKVSALDVDVHPHSGRPGKKLRVTARGFTTSDVLYAHVVRRRYHRNVRLGHVKGDCGTLSKRKRVLPHDTPAGTYTVQFDGRRHYSRKTKVAVRFRVFVFRSFRRASVSEAATRWVRLR